MPGAVTPLWRYFIADLAGNGITDYSRLASARAVEVILDAPLSMWGTVPSDNSQVYIPYDGDGYDDPYLSEGSRLLWGFRRESDTPPYYTVRAATIIQLVDDEAEQDDAQTKFVGWDPWHYMFSRPVCSFAGVLPSELTGQVLTFAAGTEVQEVVGSLLLNTITNQGGGPGGHSFIDAGAAYGGTGFFTGTLETTMTLTDDLTFQQGTSVGQAWQQLCSMGYCDIVLDPIYDPMNRPNYLAQLNVYAQAGVTRDEAIFAWNLPGRSLVGLSRIEDGSSRANKIKFYAGQGGSSGAGTLQTDAASVAKFGEYWAQQFFPGETGSGGPVAVTSLAEQQLALRANGRETVTFRPAPERSPRPWQDYGLGDRVPVWAGPNKFRKLLG